VPRDVQPKKLAQITSRSTKLPARPVPYKKKPTYVR
jgi:hypothetical protein